MDGLRKPASKSAESVATVLQGGEQVFAHAPTMTEQNLHGAPAEQEQLTVDSQSHASQKVTPGLCGLTNIGNTCYMNSTLQCLSHTSSLTSMFLNWSDDDAQKLQQNNAEVANAYRKLLSDMWGGQQVASTIEFKEALCKTQQQFAGKAQHDAPEFLTALLGRLQEELSSHECIPSSQNMQQPLGAAIHNEFAGTLQNTVHCPGCQGEFTTPEQFLCLPLPLPITDTRTLYVHVLKPLHSECTKYAVRVPCFASTEDVLERVSEVASVNCCMCLAVISGRRIRRILPANHSVSDIGLHESLYAFEIAAAACDADAPVPLARPEDQQENADMPERRDGAEADVNRSEPDKPQDAVEVTRITARPDSPMGLPPGDDAMALPPTDGPIALLPDEVIALPPPQEVLALPAPEPREIDPQDVQQVCCVCDVTEAVARRALERTSHNLERAVNLVFESPETLMTPRTSAAEGKATEPQALQGFLEDDFESFNVVPRGSCPHIDRIVDCRVAPDACCSVCGENESWVCGTCGQILCSRYKKAHMLQHVQTSGHCVALSLSDLSFWCFKCDAYLDVYKISELQPLYSECHLAKFGERPPLLAVAPAAPQAASTSDEQPVTLVLEKPEKIAKLTHPVADDNSAGAHPSQEPQNAFAQFVAAAHVRKVKESIAIGVNVQAVDVSGSPLLHAALSTAVSGHVLEKHVTTIRLLLQARADASAIDTSGRNLGHLLAERGADTLLRELYESRQLELETKDSFGQTMLHKAAAAAHPSTTALLLQLGAEPNSLDKQGLMPSDIARNRGVEEVLDELLERPRLLQVVHRVLNEVLDVQSGVEPAKDSTAALAAKEAGNAYLKVGNYPAAIEQYTLGISTASDHESELVADCYNNRAAVHVQLRNYENVVADTTECLHRCPANGKALVRRAQAYQQLEKLKAAYSDITAALNTSLSQNFLNIARTVQKEVKTLLLSDGIELDLLDVSAPPPPVAGGVSNTFQSRYRFPARPCILAVPRQRTLSGNEIYSLAWRHATCGAAPPAIWNFTLYIVGWDAEDQGELIPCDEFAITLPRRGTIAMEWEVLPNVLEHEPPVIVHSSASDMSAEDQKHVTLASCLDALTEIRTLTEENAWYCPTCQKAQLATTHSRIDRLPRILVLQLKRFYYTTRRRGKISSLVDFPISGLNLQPWCKVPEAPLFDLFAVVNHIGGFGGGHYTANAKPSSDLRGRESNAWYHFNDSLCKPISEEQLLKPEAYLLFYSQRDAT
eukprot:TRINITY_DN42092_c0_g1_i1.p1 TRINITY_DN42092_c0_g1~~TRINITY_DN42092_c0_g1_i1.p1  ORF type:complete len:1250 (-),score=214.02 TRINITY_DN42092_c0_g1_i1:186-3935(-)